MAALLNCDVFLMLTAVPNVSVNFGKPTQRPLGTVSVRDANALSDEQFGVGSMQPKIEAARFVENTGKPAVIAHLDDAIAALNGVAGTGLFLTLAYAWLLGPGVQPTSGVFVTNACRNARVVRDVANV